MSNTRTRAPRPGVLAAAVATLLAFSAQAQDLNFDIPAGDLKTALDAYIRQTGQQIVYRSDELKGRASPGAHGAMTSEQALEALLAGTNLQVRRDASGAVVVFPAEAVAGGASEGTAGQEQGLEEVVVTATPISHVYVTSRSVTRIDADPMGLPMSISAVQEDLLRQQQARTVADALSNVAGMDLTPENLLLTRGFGATAARNGSVILSDSFGNLRGRPVVATQRIEVVKGPQQIMQGTAAGYGGTVNVITKVPEADPIAFVGLGLGSRDYWRLDADLNHALADGEYGRLMGRVIGSIQDQGETLVGYRGASTDFASGGLRWVNDDWGSDVSLVYEYNDSWTPLAPLVVTTGTRFGSNLRLFNFGEDGKDYGIRGIDDTIDVNYTQTLSTNWKFAVNYIWKQTTVGVPNYFAFFNPYGPAADPDNVYAFSSVYPGSERGNGDTSDFLKVSLYGQVRSGPLNHHLLLAFDYNTSDGTSDSYPAEPAFCVTDITSWTKICTPPDPDTQYLVGRITNDVRDTGVLLTDRVQWGEWSALLGVRWADFEQRFFAAETVVNPDFTIPAAGFKREDSHVLPQYGVVYEASQDLSWYASGSEGFVSNALFKDIDGQTLPNETSSQYEVGVKALLLARQFAVTLALYRINQKNVAQYVDALPPPGQDFVYRTIDGVTSEGVEIEVSGQPVAGLQLRANYAYLSTKAETQGEPVSYGYTPNKFNIWGEYWFGREVGTGWWLGGGVNYNDTPAPAIEPQFFADLDPPIVVPWPKQSGSTVLDLSAGWSDSHWSVIGGVKNVTDERIYDLLYSASFMTSVRDERTYAFDLSYRF